MYADQDDDAKRGRLFAGFPQLGAKPVLAFFLSPIFLRKCRRVSLFIIASLHYFNVVIY
jgi:hypothetical protein